MFGNCPKALLLEIGVSVAHSPSGTLKYPGKQQPERQGWAVVSCARAEVTNTVVFVPWSCDVSPRPFEHVGMGT